MCVRLSVVIMHRARRTGPDWRERLAGGGFVRLPSVTPGLLSRARRWAAACDETQPLASWFDDLIGQIADRPSDRTP